MTAGHLFEAVSGLHAHVRLLVHAVDNIRQAVALLSLLLLSLLLSTLVIVLLHRGIHCLEAQLLAALVQLPDLRRPSQLVPTCCVTPARLDSRRGYRPAQKQTASLRSAVARNLRQAHRVYGHRVWVHHWLQQRVDNLPYNIQVPASCMTAISKLAGQQIQWCLPTSMKHVPTTVKSAELGWPRI